MNRIQVGDQQLQYKIVRVIKQAVEYAYSKARIVPLQFKCTKTKWREIPSFAIQASLIWAVIIYRIISIN